MIDKLQQLFDTAITQITTQGAPWSRYVVFKEIFNLSLDHEKLRRIKNEIVNHPKIKRLLQQLNHRDFGTLSIAIKPASFKTYASYHWQLRFLADCGLQSNFFSLEQLLHQIFIHQLPDGQFTTDYHRRNRTPFAAICVTAHLAYCLAVLGHLSSRGIQAALDFILSTQRQDGGWHCDLNKQNGEKDKFSPSCPCATIYALRALSVLNDLDQSIVDPAARLIIAHWQNRHRDESCGYFQSNTIFTKLRYPPHYWGYDLLNILDLLSCYPQYHHHPVVQEMIKKLVSKWDERGFFASEKTVPEWREFDFGKNKIQSCWLSSLVCRLLVRIFRSLDKQQFPR